MQSIQQIYSKYRIMPSLQLHQYRVAAVASYICTESMVPVEKDEIIIACLLHDMGNIIKFKLDLFPDFLKPEGLEYWRKVQEEFFQKYGYDEHEATITIATEILTVEPAHSSSLGINSTRILELIDAIGFSNAKLNYEGSDFSKKIAEYADMRVEPHGVVSLERRLEEGRVRYDVNKAKKSSREFFEEMAGFLRKIEDQIFYESSIEAVDITEQKIHSYLPSLSSVRIGSSRRQ